MGLKGYRLWVMGQLDSNVQSPTDGAARDAGLVDGGAAVRAVTLLRVRGHFGIFLVFVAPPQAVMHLKVALQVVYLKGKL
jgi:hypothetical protein